MVVEINGFLIDQGWVHSVVGFSCYTGNACGGGSTRSFYKRFIEVKCDDTLGENLGLKDTQQVSLFQWTFRLKTG